MIDSGVAASPDPIAFRHQLTSAVPLGRMASPDEVAAATVFLPGEEASDITGVALPVDGGYTTH